MLVVLFMLEVLVVVVVVLVLVLMAVLVVVVVIVVVVVVVEEGFIWENMGSKSLRLSEIENGDCGEGS